MRKKETRDIVLVVDDLPDTLRMLTDAIEEAGMTVLVAREGEYALSIVEHVLPDIILMDAVMPGMDGFETCRRLKENKALAHVPVIFMTGLSDTEHIVQGSGGRRRRLCHQAACARRTCWRASVCISPMRASRTARAPRSTLSAAFCWQRAAPENPLVHAAGRQAAGQGVQGFRHGPIRPPAQVQEWLHLRGGSGPSAPPIDLNRCVLA